MMTQPERMRLRFKESRESRVDFRFSSFNFHITILLCLGLAGCSLIPQRDTGQLYRPPAAAETATPRFVSQPTPSPAPAVPSEAPRITPTPSCTDSLTYLEDLSIPDGAQVTPGQPLDKRWRVQNSGTCNWDEHYRVKLIAGPDMGAPGEQALYPARGGTELVVRILFTAPNEPGKYRSAWQAYDPQGKPFGDPVFIEVNVAPAS
jgi:hypothetical protein